MITHSTNSQFSQNQERDFILPTINNKALPIFDCIINGSKKAEVRVFHPHFRTLNVGKIIKLINREHWVRCKITFIHTYSSFESLLFSENWQNLLPFARNKTHALNIYKKFKGADKSNQFGVVAIGIQHLENNRQN